MQTPKLIENSYFFSGNVNDKFKSYLDENLKSYRKQTSAFNWWTTSSPQKLHCTLGFLFGPESNQVPLAASAKAALAQSRLELANKVETAAKQVIGSHAPHTMHTRVIGCKITKNGWAILELKKSKKLQKFHDVFIQTMEAKGLKPSKFSRQDFMPHISIGKLKPGADKEAAEKELESILRRIQQNPLPFVLYDIDLERVHDQQNVKVLNSALSRKEVGITEVKHKKNQTKIICFSKKKDAQKLAKNLFKYYLIQSSKIPNQPKQVMSDITKNRHTLLLNETEFNKVKGHYNNLR